MLDLSQDELALFNKLKTSLTTAIQDVESEERGIADAYADYNEEIAPLNEVLEEVAAFLNRMAVQHQEATDSDDWADAATLFEQQYEEIDIGDEPLILDPFVKTLTDLIPVKAKPATAEDEVD